MPSTSAEEQLSEGYLRKISWESNLWSSVLSIKSESLSHSPNGLLAFNKYMGRILLIPLFQDPFVIQVYFL